MEYRRERDTMGEVLVPEDKYWGAQTQRSLENFKIGDDLMPTALVHAIGFIKLAAVRVNSDMRKEKMPEPLAAAIEEAAKEVAEGKLDGHFPLSVFQTGSGTQTNMNVNEVIARRAGELSGLFVHPNDHVNMSQSSNDVFPSAIHLAAILMTERELIPALDMLADELSSLEKRCEGIVKCGRTHLQDATPIAFSQEISGWRSSILACREAVRSGIDALRPLAIGGTAVGTGLNAPRGFGDAVASELSALCGSKLWGANNKFHSLSSKSELVFAHGALKALAADLMKIANDIRWLASGPRCGLGEIKIPENEPGSSIMPGKVNPTQCEAVTMVAVQVMANDQAISFAASQGNFELNVFMPLIAHNYLLSLRLLSDVCRSFAKNCVSGIEPNAEKMRENLHRSLMTATALTPHIGYERAAKVVYLAHCKGLTLKEAALSLGYLTGEQFDEVYKPEEMI